ncbi:cytochrome oxidase [Blattabacterium cuenoti]|uniref:cytochrome oxidase n=1 Tax=Blattabacterium cuenoti TaxID=1653831 RepID=UPI001EE9D024|nr:cytochrome oxidase [Blattabacterium cuenoti]
MKKYFTKDKNIGIFQSVILILFFLSFFFILFFVFSKSKKYFRKISSLPLEENKDKSI